jgi:hypothetical protein
MAKAPTKDWQPKEAVIGDDSRIVLTEEHACADCQHQIYDHRGGECRVRRSSGQMCECKGFRFKDEGTVQ